MHCVSVLVLGVVLGVVLVRVLLVHVLVETLVRSHPDALPQLGLQYRDPCHVLVSGGE